MMIIPRSIQIAMIATLIGMIIGTLGGWRVTQNHYLAEQSRIAKQTVIDTVAEAKKTNQIVKKQRTRDEAINRQISAVARENADVPVTVSCTHDSTTVVTSSDLDLGHEWMRQYNRIIDAASEGPGSSVDHVRGSTETPEGDG